MMKTCLNPWCQQSFEITPDDLVFYEKVSPVFKGKKELIPPPTRCPTCRSMRRMIWRNERSLYLRKCEGCKKSKVSMFAEDAPYHTLCHNCFYGDNWEPLLYGRNYDFSKTFSENMESLLQNVPLMMLFQSGINENCEFTNFFGPDSRNCYLIYNSGRDEDCSFSRGLIESKSCLDMLIGDNNQFCYECINASGCYNVLFSQNVSQCSESAFLFNCQGCHNCIGCTNLVKKENHAFNQPCTPSEYFQLKEKLSTASFMALIREKLREMKQQCVHRENNNMNTESCTGDYLTASKNCTDCYETQKSEDCKRLLCSKLCKDSQDLFGFGYDSQLLYECTGVGLSTSVACSWICTSVMDSMYCVQCDNLQHCFGCVGLRRKQYCILNKQYSKEAYEELVPSIIDAMRSAGEWGEFLPWGMAPFAYNETVAQEFLPLSKEEAISKGFRWRDEAPLPPPAAKTITANQLPDRISEVPDDILQWAIECEITRKPFKITQQELAFYRTIQLPIPRFHPDERHRQRMALTNPRKLWQRQCAKCHKPIATSYSPERPEKVLCEECYLKEVY